MRFGISGLLIADGFKYPPARGCVNFISRRNTQGYIALPREQPPHTLQIYFSFRE